MTFEQSANVVPFRARREARAILQAGNPSAMQEIRAPGIGAVIWQRKPLLEFSNWIDALPVENLPMLRTMLTIDTVEACVQAACDSAETPNGKMRDILASDIAALAFIFSEVMQTSFLHLRLDAISNDACRRFHVDNMAARMLCTYRGVGTQIAQPGQEHVPMDVTLGSAVILRGDLWPGDEVTGLLHRSPPINGTGQTRLLLAIDRAADHSQDESIH